MHRPEPALTDLPFQSCTKTVWPSGLRLWLKAPFRKGVGSNPTAVTGCAVITHEALCGCAQATHVSVPTPAQTPEAFGRALHCLCAAMPCYEWQVHTLRSVARRF